MLKTLPTGIQSFSDLRERDCLYVDKTKEIYRLITSGKVYFLSRPRRFGKSLLVSTLDALFKGQKNLFTGLYITDKIDWSKKYPIIKLDWTAVSHNTREDMENSMAGFLEGIGESYQITLKERGASNLFRELIVRLHEKSGCKVVVLVDEYDAPLLDVLGNSPALIEPVHTFLQTFYRIIKASDEDIHFVFITGVTKFTKVSVFSALNNLIDITLDKEYAAICGWTQEELESYFDPYIALMAKTHESTRQDILDAIKDWYNGFSWDGLTPVYNPFSTLLLFTKKDFGSYWFSSRTPSFLVNIIKERNDVKLALEPVQIQSSGFESFDYKTLETKLLLFQTGYLTVKQIKKGPIGVPPVYTLGIPNNEVRDSLLEYLVSSYAEYPLTDTAIMRERMQEQLVKGEVSAFEASAKELFAGIPYQLHIPREAYYHSLLLLWLTMLGFEVQGEVSTDKGRIDAVWILHDQVIIVEVKFTQEGNTALLLDDAFNQIHERRYYEGYIGNNRKVSLLAVGFTDKEIACKMTEL